jgi:hypothetical protein
MILLSPVRFRKANYIRRRGGKSVRINYKNVMTTPEMR